MSAPPPARNLRPVARNLRPGGRRGRLRRLEAANFFRRGHRSFSPAQQKVRAASEASVRPSARARAPVPPRKASDRPRTECGSRRRRTRLFCARRVLHLIAPAENRTRAQPVHNSAFHRHDLDLSHFCPQAVHSYPPPTHRHRPVDHKQPTHPPTPRSVEMCRTGFHQQRLGTTRLPTGDGNVDSWG